MTEIDTHVLAAEIAELISKPTPALTTAEQAAQPLAVQLNGEGTADDARALAGRLERMGVLRAAQPPPAPVDARGGRPPSPTYEVHPELTQDPDTTDKTEGEQ